MPEPNKLCEIKTLCALCRGSKLFRRDSGLPDACPHGITAANLPTPQTPAFDPLAHALEQAREAGSTGRRCCGH